VQQHGIAEMQVAQSGIPWVMLRPHDFMQVSSQILHSALGLDRYRLMANFLPRT
jgi:uncharacterized protein YbjT (DUF2867 family)